MQHIGEILKKQNHPAPIKLATPSSTNGTPEAVCPICQGAGVICPRNGDGRVDWGRTVPCQCQAEELEKARRISYLENCQLPALTEKMTFDKFKVDSVTKSAYDYAVKVAEEDGLKWLALTGHSDLGKTHLAVAVCRRWLERGKPARYAYVPLLLDELRAGFELTGDDSYRAKFKFIRNVPLLVLDDLGVEKPSEFAQEKLNTIIDYRYMNALPLVVTLNKSLDQIPGDSEHRIASRLQRFPLGKVVELKGEEYRLRKVKK